MRCSPGIAKGIKNDGRQRADGHAAERRRAAGAGAGALADTLVRVSYLAMHLEGHLAELEINPLMVLPSGQGVQAIDALVVLRGT
jgi:succinyl-CoA synthetase beta subunit